MHPSPDPIQRRIDDIARALEVHPRFSGLVFRAERWQVASSIWSLTALPVSQHRDALHELCNTLAPYDPSAMDALCAAYRRAILRWGGAERTAA